MKILIPYDGSKNADIALDYLHAAEFAPEEHEILVVVTDVWLPETVEEFFSTRALRKRQTEMSGSSSYAPALRDWEEERFLARDVRRRLESKFPSWDVTVTTLAGFSLVSSEVLEKAESWGADLIILGSQSDSGAPGAQAVAAKARCPVRIVRDSHVGKLNALFY
jgi:nucleotide-binding universal stress UspA family protein